MIQRIISPQRSDWDALLVRPTQQDETLMERVDTVLQAIRKGGDRAVKEFVKEFDQVDLDDLLVSEQEFEAAEGALSEELKSSILAAAENIRRFHAAQLHEEVVLETMSGVVCRQRSMPIEKVGLYIPGGTAPLFSTVLMLALPARIAGCREIVLCSPSDKEGRIHPAILFAARVAGVTRFFKLGGIQAVGAMAYGTESVPKVYKIFGPGNRYVTAAKQLVSLRDVAIDMPAGPSEVAVIADESANAAFVASDFLSQAEHGNDSQSLLFTTSETLADRVDREIEKQLEQLSRKGFASSSLLNSKIIVMSTLDEVMDICNEYAPEHLIIQTENYHELAERVVNAGSVFLGAYTPESAGDYASGTNHTLPTNGYAKMYSGVNLDSFMKKITFQEITPEGLNRIGAIIETMAAAEELDAHKNAVTIRLAAKANK